MTKIEAFMDGYGRLRNVARSARNSVRTTAVDYTQGKREYSVEVVENLSEPEPVPEANSIPVYMNGFYQPPKQNNMLLFLLIIVVLFKLLFR